MIRRLFLLTALVFGLVSSASAGDYVAFSLKRAGEVLQAGDAEMVKQALSLAGITRPHALVFDAARGDLILVGERDVKLPALTLDDWAVAVRSEFVVGRDPVVSIDQTPETPETRKQTVRFEGALKDTQFGADMLQADIVLKQLGLGKTSAEIFGVSSFLKLSAVSYKAKPTEQSDFTRFWFLPLRSESYVFARNGIVIVEDYKIDVQNQRYVEGKDANDSDSAVNSFAQSIRTSFGDLKTMYPSLARMEQLYYLTALAQGLGVLDVEKLGDSTKYWLDTYKIRHVETRSTYPLEENSTEMTLDDGRVARIWLSGGIDLDAMVVDLEDGMPDALKLYILASRPGQTSLSWEVPLVTLSWSYDVDRRATDSAVKNLRSKGDVGMSILRQVGSPAALRSNPVHVPTADFKFAAPSDFSSRLPENELRRVSPDVGGVMLKGAASVVGDAPSSVDASKLFTLIASGDNAVLSREAHRRFVTALWSVYYSNEDPGISIDPIAWGADKQLVRYIGRVVNTDLGRVMRDADYLMKKWAVGTEKPDIPGFRDVDTIAGVDGMTYADASRRFWFVPEGMTFKASDGVFLFDHGRITLKTELMLEGRQTHVVESDQEFARFFTDHYEQIAARYPVYDELFEYAKLVSVAKYLKQQNVPLHWFLMAHLDDVITEDSIGAVDTLSKGSKFLKDVRIEGGVDMSGQYVLDETASAAIQRAVSRLGQPRQRPGLFRGS